jgi:hypothetical protein
MTDEDRTAGQERPIQWMLPSGYTEPVPEQGVAPHVRDGFCSQYGCIPWTPHQPESAKEPES